MDRGRLASFRPSRWSVFIVHDAQTDPDDPVVILKIWYRENAHGVGKPSQLMVRRQPGSNLLGLGRQLLKNSRFLYHESNQSDAPEKVRALPARNLCLYLSSLNGR